MIDLYTIGFTRKSAEQFFGLLQNHQVRILVDTRANNVSQLSGFAKGNDLAFFAREIGGIHYQHRLDFAPTKELLARYRSGELTWPKYEVEYLNLLDLRQIGRHINPEELHQHCLLCSEHSPEHCHRRLLAEYLQQRFNGITIHHLIE